MNKKLLVGIIVGVAVLIAAVIVILSVSTYLKLNLNKDNKDKEETTSDVSSDVVASNESQSGDKTSSSATDVQLETKSTGKETVDVEDATEDNGTYTVPIYATKNDGMCAARIFVKFDSSKFDYADVKAGDIFDECIGNYENGQAVIVATSSNGVPNIKGAGVIANLVLVPKAGVEPGEYSVTVDSKSEYANNNDELVKPTVEAGKIIIK